VAIDQPIIPDSLFSMPPPELRFPSPRNIFRVNVIGQLLVRFIESDLFKYTLYAFGAAFFVSLMFQSTKPVASSIGNFFKMVQGRIHRIMDHFQRDQVVGIPMPFDSSSQGWGVCTLRSKRRLGRTSFVQYEFDLPEPDYVLPLELGQTVALCCLDNDNNVAKGDFFPYYPSHNTRPKPGSFSILVPNRSPHDMEYAIGDEAANFVSNKKELFLVIYVVMPTTDTRFYLLVVRFVC
jgi:hypothetical protein